MNGSYDWRKYVTPEIKSQARAAISASGEYVIMAVPMFDESAPPKLMVYSSVLARDILSCPVAEPA